MEMQFWAGIFAPAGTPPAIVKKLEAEITRVVKLADFSERMAILRINPVGSTSEEFSKMLAADIARWSALAKAANIKAID